MLSHVSNVTSHDSHFTMSYNYFINMGQFFSTNNINVRNKKYLKASRILEKVMERFKIIEFISHPSKTHGFR